MSSWVVASIFSGLLLIAALVWLWTVRLRRDTTKVGMRALAAMNWHHFSQAVERALTTRGMRTSSEELPTNDAQSGILMESGDEQWLVACKHGASYRINAHTLEDLAQAARLQDAHGVILATEGKLTPDGLAAAQQHQIEVLSGQRLWQTVRNELPTALRDQVEGGAKRTAQRNSVLAVAASICLAFAATHLLDSPDAYPVPVAVAHAAASIIPSPEALQRAQQADAAATVDEKDLHTQRLDVSKALSAAPGIIRGVWISKLTLVIDRHGEDAMVWPKVCSELERYPSLRTSRVQMNPPAGSSEPVRWRQCKTM